VNTFAHNSTYRAGMARLRKNFVHPECGLVYALLDPLSHEVRYVGKTTKGVSERVFAHFHFHTACREWMVGLLSENLFPQVHILELVPLEPDGGHNVLRSREIAWINALYSAGSPLLNRQSFKLRDAISEMPVGDLLSVALIPIWCLVSREAGRPRALPQGQRRETRSWVLRPKGR
jgi:hypothetical protein